MSFRIFHTAGPGGVIQAHEHWKRKDECPTEVAITNSSQFEQFCQDIGATGYIIGYHPDRRILHDGAVTLEQRPKPLPGARGPMYHLAEILYGLSLLVTAVRFRANLAVIDSGTTHYFVTSLFRLMGIRVVPLLHNSIWPDGFPPTRPIPRLVRWLDSLFYRYVATAVVGVSPVCVRQVEQLTSGRHPPLYQMRYQFSPDHFRKFLLLRPTSSGRSRLCLWAGRFAARESSTSWKWHKNWRRKRLGRSGGRSADRGRTWRN